MDTDAQLAMLKDAKRELGEARVRVAHLEQLVDGLTGLLASAGVPTSAPPRQDPLPGMGVPTSTMRPRDAVLMLLQNRPGLAMTPRRVFEALSKRGWVNPDISSGQAAYDMALRRLADEPGTGVHRDEDAGTYVFRGTDEAVTASVKFANGSGRSVRFDVDGKRLDVESDSPWLKLTAAEVRELEARNKGFSARKLTGAEYAKYAEFKAHHEGRPTAHEHSDREPQKKVSGRERADDALRAKFLAQHEIVTRHSTSSKDLGDPV